MNRKGNDRLQRRGAYRVLFPLAAVFAALAVPIWLLLRDSPPGYAAPLWHGHEMLFGYTAAVVAGFLITRASRLVRVLLLISWFAARLAPFVPDAWLALVLGISFPLMLLAPAALPLLRGAKRWENRIVPAVLLVLLGLDGMWWSGALWLGGQIQQHALLATVDLFALLMLIVGGRAVPAAVGGYLERNGIPRRDYPRRGYELPIAGLAGSACLLDALGLAAAAGVFNVATALVTLIRILPWQLHYSRSRVALWALALGYSWLIPGLLLKGIAVCWTGIPVATAVHGITIGALGTLTLTMMARTAALQARQPLQGFADVGIGVLFISVSALLRLLTPLAQAWQSSLLWAAALLWSAAFLVLLRRLWRIQSKTGN
ncbi:MAG: NnrS family protein [Gammaproteobacteria bacterium]